LAWEVRNILMGLRVVADGVGQDVAKLPYLLHRPQIVGPAVITKLTLRMAHHRHG